MSEREIKWKYPESIVSCEWLRKNLSDKNIRIYDCTTYLHYTDTHPSKPYDVESGIKNYRKGHIPNSAFMDIQEKLSIMIVTLNLQFLIMRFLRTIFRT